jgi:hypothetical protein
MKARDVAELMAGLVAFALVPVGFLLRLVGETYATIARYARSRRVRGRGE